VKLAMALPHEFFHCDRYHAELRKVCCVQRQNTAGESRSATRTSKGLKRSVRKWIPPFLYFCASGRCIQGAAIAASLPPQEAIKIRRSGR
jgi:hypothetical protein